jgi:hypothetical protein
MFPIRDTIPRRNPPIATWLLILINSLIFLFELMMPPPAREQFFRLFGMVPARFTHPDWAVWAGFPLDDYWPFLTSMPLRARGCRAIIGGNPDDTERSPLDVFPVLRTATGSQAAFA